MFFVLVGSVWGFCMGILYGNSLHGSNTGIMSGNKLYMDSVCSPALLGFYVENLWSIWKILF